MDVKDSARTSPLITGTLQKVCQFARMSFRFCQNTQKDFPRNQIFVAEFTNQGSVGLDLPAFEQQVFNDHFSEGRALFGMNPDCRGLSRQLLEIKDWNTAQLLNTSCQPIGMSQFLFSMSLELGLQSGRKQRYGHIPMLFVLQIARDLCRT